MVEGRATANLGLARFDFCRGSGVSSATMSLTKACQSIPTGYDWNDVYRQHLDMFLSDKNTLCQFGWVGGGAVVVLLAEEKKFPTISIAIGYYRIERNYDIKNGFKKLPCRCDRSSSFRK